MLADHKVFSCILKCQMFRLLILVSSSMHIAMADTIDVYLPCYQVTQFKKAHLMDDNTLHIHAIHCAKLLDQALNEKVKGYAQKDANITAKAWSSSHLMEYMRDLKADNNALGLGVKYIPGIVFNQRYVVYGTDDISYGQRLFQQYKQSISSQGANHDV